MILKRDSSVKGFVDIVGLCAEFSSQAALDAFGRSLGATARRARVYRQEALVEGAVETLLRLPVAEDLHNLARYYQAQALRGGTDGLGLAVSALEDLVYKLPSEYRSRALLTLGVRYRFQGRIRDSFALHLEAAKAAQGTDLLTEVQSIRGLAIVRSILGDHRGAYDLLAGLLGPALYLRHTYAPEYLDYLNSVAMEMLALGRVGEAHALIDRVLRGARAIGYVSPHWTDTKHEVLNNSDRPAPPLVFPLGGVQNQVSESILSPPDPVRAASDSRAVSKKFLPTIFPLGLVYRVPTKRPRVQRPALKPQFLLARKSRPRNSHSPRAPPPAC